MSDLQNHEIIENGGFLKKHTSTLIPQFRMQWVTQHISTIWLEPYSCA